MPITVISFLQTDDSNDPVEETAVSEGGRNGKDKTVHLNPCFLFGGLSL